MTDDPRDRWLDREAGPLVRPYAMTQGRTRPSGASFDLIAVVAATGEQPGDRLRYSPEHARILRRCGTPVVDIRAALSTPQSNLGAVLVDYGPGSQTSRSGEGVAQASLRSHTTSVERASTAMCAAASRLAGESEVQAVPASVIASTRSRIQDGITAGPVRGSAA